MKTKFFVLAAVIFSIRLSAQTGVSVLQDSAKGLDEVVISASKYPGKTSLTGKVVTIITQAQIEKSSGKDLAQLLSEQAGIFIGGANSNPGKDKSLYLRGGYVSHTLITIDGIPVYDPSGIGGNFDLRNLSLNNIEKIEILKGCHSTLYGSDAINGVINLISKKSSKKTVSANSGVSYGSNETFRGNAGLNGKHGIVDYNASYSYFNTKGINESVNKTNSTTTDLDGYQQKSLQINFGIRPSEKVTIQPFLRYGKINGDIDQGAFTDEQDYTYTQKSWQTGVKNEFSFGKMKLNILYNYNNINRRYIDDSVKSRNGYDIYSKGVYSGNEHLADVFIFTPLNQFLKLTAGFDYRNSNSNQEYLSIGFFGPYKTNYSSDSLRQNQLSVYSTLNLNTKKGFNAELGARLNHHSSFNNYFVFNINPSYLIENKIKVFANLSSGYKTPSLYQLFSEYGNSKLNPETATTTEAGVQYYSPDKKLNTRITGFTRNVKNVIVFYYNPSTFKSQYINQDKQNDYGFEWEASYTIKNNTTVKAGYSFTDGEINTKTATGKDTTYFNLLRRPKSSFTLNISSQLTDFLFISTNLSAVGKRNDAYFDSNLFSTVPTVLKKYILLDLYSEYAFNKKRIKLFTELRNITNTKYSEIAGFNTQGFNGYGGIRFTL